MKTFVALLRRHARDSFVALIAAPLVSALVLGVVHIAFPKPIAVAEAAEMALVVLISLWSLYFAADLFAADLESGRLATQARLPVTASKLFAARIAFLALVLAALASSLVALEWALEALFESPATFEHFRESLPSAWIAIPVLCVLASTATVASLVADSALSAMFIALFLVALFSGAAIGLQRAFAFVDVQWHEGYAVLALFLLAGKLVTIAYAAFVRGQRKLGSRGVRAKVAFASLALMLIGTGALSAAEIYRRSSTDLEDSWIDLAGIQSSPDGKRIALEAMSSDRSNAPLLESVWTIELDNGERTLVARQGMLFDSDRRDGGSWDGDHRLEIVRASIFGEHGAAYERVDLSHDFAATPISDAELRNRCVHSRAIPDWAEVHPKHENGAFQHAMIVTWKSHGISRVVSGDNCEVWPGSGLICSPCEGIVWRLRGGRLMRLELENGVETPILEGPFARLSPSPDGEAFIAHGKERSLAIDASSGAPIGDTWSSADGGTWIEGCAQHRYVCRGTRDDARQVVDLASGASFELAIENRSSIYRVGDRGYVYVAKSGNLIWIDDHGRPIRTLVERSR